MKIEIRKLCPELIPDYIHFFDTTPHATNKEEHKCYCIWYTNQDCTGLDYSTAEKRRDIAINYIKANSIQGYLAYCDGKVVGWCNANTKKDCYECFCWRRFMGDVRKESPDAKIKVKSVFCFAIAPELRHKGVATALLQRVCEDAVKDGFDFVEAYPGKSYVSEEEDYTGPIGMYKKLGFEFAYETEKNAVMIKALK